MRIKFNVCHIYFLILFEIKYLIDIQKTVNQQQELKKRLIQKDPFFIKFKDQLIGFNSLSKKDRLVVAVSGGLDSVTLLLLLKALEYNQLIVAHINHQLRQESDDEEYFVEKLSRDLKIPFYNKTLDPKYRDNKASIEEWARNERYCFLKTIHAKTKSKWIMTAHHGNDQVETLLMNLGRQTGVSGLRGIAKKRDNILRPMLNFSKIDIIEFSKRIGYNYCEDLSNSDISIPRNFIRHKVINNWEKQFPNIISGIRNSIDHFNEWKNSLDFMIKTYLIEKVIQNKKDLIISKDFITTLPKMVKIRLIQLLIDNENQLWSKHQIKMLNQFIDKSSTGTIHELHNGFRILNNRGNLIINRPCKDKMHSVELCPNIPTSYLNFKYELIVQDQIKDFSKNSESVDWSKLKNKKLELRIWKEGDSFQPLGMRGHQKISDFLINQKVDRISKESQSVLTADGKIVWVCGKRISNYIRLTDQTSETATLTWDYLHS